MLSFFILNTKKVNTIFQDEINACMLNVVLFPCFAQFERES